MIYMVEMNFPHPERQAEFDTWYGAHLHKLVSVPGFLSAQRFESTSPTASPYLAIYALESADVLTSAPYKAKFGPQATGNLRPLITNWLRNLLSGLSEAPEVPRDGWVALMDRRSEQAPPLDPGYVSLKPAGLDRSMVERGLLIGSADRAPPQARESADLSLRVFKPLTGRLLHAAA